MKLTFLTVLFLSLGTALTHEYLKVRAYESEKAGKRALVYASFDWGANGGDCELITIWSKGAITAMDYVFGERKHRVVPKWKRGRP